ncbi:hypothetical protein ACFLZ7_03590 [Nanoarchaeota archaeon]
MSLYGLGDENSNSQLTQPIDYVGIPPYKSKKPAPKQESEASREFRERMEREISGSVDSVTSVAVERKKSEVTSVPIKIL